ncbi:MAG: hypothetical protein OXI59_19635, partial [Gemmatimonadota bacterium]|nr:hypothetical protein [Gemmatimonadota bacterium]
RFLASGQAGTCLAGEFCKYLRGIPIKCCPGMMVAAAVVFMGTAILSGCVVVLPGATTDSENPKRWGMHWQCDDLELHASTIGR